MLRRPVEPGAYVSGDFCSMADLAGLQVSFGSTGDCYDNAAMETFWSTLKREITWIRGSIYFPTRHEARLYLFEFIEVFYNRQRHQARLGNRPRSSSPPPSTHDNRNPVTTEAGQGQSLLHCFEPTQTFDTMVTSVLEPPAAEQPRQA